MELKDFIMSGIGLLLSIMSYAYIRDIKALKESLDGAVATLNKHAETNIDAHKEIWIELHRIDKDQANTATIVNRCKSCSGSE